MQTVCLVGKPNVGKSSIFNRLIKENKSIIMDTPGVTRDRIYGKVEYNNKRFHLIDTGGISLGDDDFQKDILAQATLAIDEADLVLFVVDGIEDIDASDRKVAEILHRSSKPVIVVVNKLDNDKRKDNLYNFYELGFSELVAVSASHNIGINELLNTITKDLPEEDIIDDDTIKFSIIGRPNVGKSSLINALLNEERVIVSNTSGTTRDAIDTPFTYHNQKFTVIDTAGMRKKGKIYENVERYSLLRALKAIDRSDVCVLVINAEEGIIEHDKHIASYALDAGKPIVIVVNKWDVIENKDKQMKEFTTKIRNNFQFISYAPIVFLSALTKKRIHTLIPEIIKVYENSKREVKTSVLNGVIMDAYTLNIPPSYKGKRLKIYFSSQVSTCPPTFNIHVNSKGLVHFSYERYLENKIRESFDFEGTPIVIQFKNKGEEEM